MQISETYCIDENTGRVVVHNPLGTRLRPILGAGLLHVSVFAALWLSGLGEGMLSLDATAEQEVAFVVETYFEPVVEETPPEEIPQEEQATPLPVEPILEEETAEIIEEAPEEEKTPEPEPLEEKPVPRLQVEPVAKPKPVIKPQKPIQARVIEYKEAPQAPVAPRNIKTAMKSGFIKPVYPAYLRNPAPRYPKSAKRRRLEGVVELKVQVGADGQVLSLSLYKSCGHDSLDNAALQTVRFWRFVPGKKNGTAVTSDVIVPIRFQLKTDSD